jgi:hypothetical protein
MRLCLAPSVNENVVPLAELTVCASMSMRRRAEGSTTPLELQEQQTVRHGVGIEDLREARCDHRFEAELLESPDRVLAARAAAKIRAAYQHLRVVMGRLVQHAAGDPLTPFVKAQVVKQPLAQAVLVDDAQELLGHDLVGIEVLDRRGHGVAFYRRQSSHGAAPACLRR